MQTTMTLDAPEDARTNQDTEALESAKQCQKRDMERQLATAKIADSGITFSMDLGVKVADKKGNVSLF